MDILTKIKFNKLDKIKPEEIVRHLDSIKDIYNDPVVIELLSSKENYELYLEPILETDYNITLNIVRNKFNAEYYFKKHINMLNENNLIYGFELKNKLSTIFEKTMPIDCKWFVNYLRHKYAYLSDRKMDLTFIPSIRNFNYDFDWAKNISLQQKKARVKVIKSSAGTILSDTDKDYIYINLKEYYLNIMGHGTTEANFQLLNTFFHELTHAKQYHELSMKIDAHNYKISKQKVINNRLDSELGDFYPFAYTEYDARVKANELAINEILNYNFDGKNKLIKQAKEKNLIESVYILNEPNEKINEFFDEIVAEEEVIKGFPEFDFEYVDGVRRSIIEFLVPLYRHLPNDLGDHILENIIDDTYIETMKNEFELLNEHYQSIVIKVIKQKLNQIIEHKVLTERLANTRNLPHSIKVLVNQKRLYLNKINTIWQKKYNVLTQRRENELYRSK